MYMRLKNENGHLSIQSNGRWRTIGQIKFEESINEDVLVIEKDNIENFVSEYDGYGFYHEIIKDERLPNIIRLVETLITNKTKIYHLSRSNIILNGVLDQSEEFNKQIFLSMTKIKRLDELS